MSIERQQSQSDTRVTQTSIFIILIAQAGGLSFWFSSILSLNSSALGPLAIAPPLNVLIS